MNKSIKFQKVSQEIWKLQSKVKLQRLLIKSIMKNRCTNLLKSRKTNMKNIQNMKMKFWLQNSQYHHLNCMLQLTRRDNLITLKEWMIVKTNLQQWNLLKDLLDQNHAPVQEWVLLEDIKILQMDVKVDQDHEED